MKVIMKFLDTLINDANSKGIDFSNDKYFYNLQDEAERDLKTIFSEHHFTIKQMEGILLLTQAKMQPIINWFLQNDCFGKITDLKNAFSDIMACSLQDRKPSINKIADYIRLCYYAGNIVGEYDEDSENCSYEEYEQLQSKWHEEKLKMTQDEQIMAEFGYVLFETFYYFICYFEFEGEDITKERIQNLCIDQIQNLLFGILWIYDEERKEHFHTYKCVEMVEEIKKDIAFIMTGFSTKEFKARLDRESSLLSSSSN